MPDGFALDGNIEEEHAEVRDQAGAWTRFWARLVDVNLWSFPIGMAVGYLFPSFTSSTVFEGSGGSLLFGACLLPVVMFVDAACIAIFGNTPGKALSGIRTETIRHEKLDFQAALRRNGLVYLKGMGLGIPFVALVTYSNAFSRVKNGDQTSWDRDLYTRVYDVGNNLGRTVIVAVLALIAIIGGRAFDQIQEREAYRSAQTMQMPSDPTAPSIDPVSVQLAKVAATIKPQMVDAITVTADATPRIRLWW